MKANIECDVQLFVTEHKTEIDLNTGNPLKNYYATMNFVGATPTHYKFVDLHDTVKGFNDLDLQSNYWGRAGQGDFMPGPVSIPENETVKHYIGFRSVLQNINYGDSVNRILVYMQTKNLTEPELIIFESGAKMDKFLDGVLDIRP